MPGPLTVAAGDERRFVSSSSPELRCFGAYALAAFSAILLSACTGTPSPKDGAGAAKPEVERRSDAGRAAPSRATDANPAASGGTSTLVANGGGAGSNALAADPSANARAPQPTSTSIRFGDSGSGWPTTPIFPNTTYDARVPHPDTLLPQPLGTFTAHHAEITAVLRAIAAAAPERVRLVPFGRTHEGRELVSFVVTSPDNMKRLDAIRADVARLADPRGVDSVELERIVTKSPAVAWLGYSIHGDEMSGADASMAVAYHLAAGTSADVTDVLANVVVVIDPTQNPDGRERILSQLVQSAGYVPNLDYAAMQRGRWPFGRENHYLFDMNRDWLWGTQPETRARWAAIGSWHPQLLVDAHEMGPNDTFLFYPATDPFTPYFPEYTKRWWQTYAADQATAFDAHGWSYYTREWADSWYPGYTDSWASFVGACGILYEQAHYRGQALRRPSGEIVTYHDAVARQAVGSLANVTTLARQRERALREYLQAKQANCDAATPGNDRLFVLVPGRSPDRERRFLANLLEQGIEVRRATAAFRGTAVQTAMEGTVDEREFPAGAWIVSPRQPLSPLVKASLTFDPRYDAASLARERKELERKQRSRAYDVTGWSPVHGFDLDGAWCAFQDVSSEPLTRVDAPETGVVPAADPRAPVYAWIVDGRDDSAVRFAARAMELGLQVNLADEAFRAAGRPFERGSLLVRRVENGADVADLVARAAREAGARAFATTTARSADDGADLGGRHFDLLARPRVAILSNDPVDSGSFGHAWHVLDVHLGLPSTHLDAQSFGGYDLRRYNVIVVPDGGGSIVRDHADALRTWVRGGGTLIAWGGAAEDVCDADTRLSGVRSRGDALDDLDAYALAVKREREAGRGTIDVEALYGTGQPTPTEAKPEGAADGKSGTTKDGAKDAKSDSKPDSKTPGEDKKARDRWLRTYSPQGVLLRGEVNEDAWITAGCGAELPVFVEGSTVLLSRLPVRTAVRVAASERMRLSGLLWPEARERIADSAWCTTERVGAGQVVLFASSPVFRDWFRANVRLFANAVVYGPGAGASQPGAW